MQAFQFYIDDDRYSVPTVLFVDTDHEDGAMALAQRVFGQSDKYRRLKAFQGDVLRFTLGEDVTEDA